MNRTLRTVLLLLIGYAGTSESSSFNVMDYGAVRDGRTLNTRAIQKAIDVCAEQGGGTVYFPAGNFLSGTLYLKSRVTLFLEAGAVLTGSKNLNDYPVTVPGIRSYTDNYTDKSLIYGENLDTVAIAGQGVIDGNGASFTVPEAIRRRNLFDSYKMRPFLIRLINCENVAVRNLTIVNSAMWVQHYLACKNVAIDGVTVASRVNANNDGLDIDACENVRIANCHISSGDDAIVLKSTLDRPCRNVAISNCILSSDCNAFKLGTESTSDFHNIVFSNCIIRNTRSAGIALEMVDGGSLNNVSIAHVTMDTVGCTIFIRLGNRARPFLESDPKAYTDRRKADVRLAKPGMGSLFNVLLSQIQATHVGPIGCSITGLASHPVRDVTLNTIRLNFQGGGTKDLASRNIEELPEKYPEYGMFGKLAAYGFYCRHVAGLTMNDVELSYSEPDLRPALVLNDVQDGRISDLKAECEEETEALILVKNSKQLLFRDCYGSGRTETGILTTRGDNPDLYFTNSRSSGAAFSAADKADGKKADDTPVLCDDREITIVSPGDIHRKRLELIQAIWVDDKIPDRSNVLVTANIKNPLHANPVIKRVDRILIPVAGLDSVKDLAYFFVPAKRNQRLIIFSPGHTTSLMDDDRHGARIEATLSGLLQAGFDVLAVFMPHVPEAAGPDFKFDHAKVIQTDLGIKDPLPTYGLRLFLDPVLVSLNYVLKKNRYRSVDMAGLSGGGWTTNLIAAVDERIQISFNIAGSIPLYYREGGSIGDIEQHLPDLYCKLAGYPDLYVLGACGPGRKQIQILNRHDHCCFGQKQHDPSRDYDSDMRSFAAAVEERLESLGEKGHYRLIIDETAINHQISEYALHQVILPALRERKK